ncbi:hypothetical protein JW756_02875, partial [Candidatus Woesearchaeota archaeon]|nr:hypothetical protein [Candidatus Woesearchaeota archaeon]
MNKKLLLFAVLIFLMVVIIYVVALEPTDRHISEYDNSTNSDGIIRSQEILDVFNNQTWVRFIIYYRSDVENLTFDNVEERKNYVSNLTHSLFDYIPSTKIRNIKSGLSNS